MDFSSSPPKKLQNLENPSPNQQKQPGNKRDWLELGLGLSSTEVHETKLQPFISSSSPLEQSHKLTQQKILNLGFESNALTSGTNTTSSGAHYDLEWMHHRDQEINSHDHVHVSSPSLFPVDGSPDLRGDGYTTRPGSSSAGVWFTLHSSTNREGESLPQVPTGYIRVRDENMTVFTVQKYLVTKLGLPNEAEVEISCMGQNLLQTQKLKHVRDFIWLPRLLQVPESNGQYHLMSLDYKRRSTVGFDA